MRRTRSRTGQSLLLAGALSFGACDGEAEPNPTRSVVGGEEGMSGDVKPEAVPDEWDFYLARVDDASASILLNLWFRGRGPIAETPTLYWCAVRMTDAGEHGMGTSEEMEILGPLEDALNERCIELGFHPVGRLRNRGRWQMAYYGPADSQPMFEQAVSTTFAAAVGRELDTGSRDDPEWSYYTEFLLPDEERWQWMLDRSVVESLERHGDDGSIPREIDHWIYFSSASDRDGFLSAIEGRGFAIRDSHDEGEGERRFALQIWRKDSADLDSIHAVVMDLKTIAVPLKADYDGWETFVVKPDSD